eukprot:scaffold72870_cov63-Phaeocystis_antarctica.AAC.4
MESVIGYGKPQLLRICAVVGKMHGMCMGCAWDVHGTRMARAWHVHGMCMCVACAWHVHMCMPAR